MPVQKNARVRVLRGEHEGRQGTAWTENHALMSQYGWNGHGVPVQLDAEDGQRGGRGGAHVWMAEADLEVMSGDRVGDLYHLRCITCGETLKFDLGGLRLDSVKALIRNTDTLAMIQAISPCFPNLQIYADAPSGRVDVDWVSKHWYWPCRLEPVVSVLVEQP